MMKPSRALPVWQESREEARHLDPGLPSREAEKEERQDAADLVAKVKMQRRLGQMTESMHGAGSPQAQRIMLARLADLEKKVQYARKLAGIEEQKEDE